jgi:1-acyl-sn-glycerol-3-phosphate acyltransferase
MEGTKAPFRRLCMSSDASRKVATQREKTISRFRWRWYDTLCLYLPFGWLIFLNRHWNFYHRALRPVAWAGYECLFFLLPFGFYFSMGLRALRERFFPASVKPTPATSCSICGESCINDLLLVRDYSHRWCNELVSVLDQKYFRAEYRGLEKVPTQGPAIIMMNHAGMAFPWDFMLFGAKLHQINREQPNYLLRAPGEKAFTRNKILRYILPEGWTGTLGGVEATYQNFEKIIKHKQLSLYAPEGAGGMGKSWGQRYQLQHFHTSAIRLAAVYNVPIVPVVCVGNEWLHPFAYDVKAIARLLKFPFFGVSPFSIWVLLFPSMLPWSLPAQMRYYVSDPVHLPRQDYASFTDGDWQKLADQFKLRMQQQIDGLLKK